MQEVVNCVFDTLLSTRAGPTGYAYKDDDPISVQETHIVAAEIGQRRTQVDWFGYHSAWSAALPHGHTRYSTGGGSGLVA